MDAMKKHDLVVLLSTGMTQKEAAGYVGVDARSIRRELKRDPDFANDYGRAQTAGKFRLLSLINAAAGRGNWHAAAFLLERLWPEEFGRRAAESFSKADVTAIAGSLADVAAEFVPKEKLPALRSRCDTLIRSFASD